MGAFSIMGNRAIGKAQNKHNQMQSQISRHYHTQALPYTYTPNHAHTVTTKTLTQQQLSWNLILEGNEPGRNKSQNPWGKAEIWGSQTGGNTQYCACSCLMCLLEMCPAMLPALTSLLSSCLWPTNCVASATANKVHTPVWVWPLQHLLRSSPPSSLCFYLSQQYSSSSVPTRAAISPRRVDRGANVGALLHNSWSFIVESY